VSVIHFNRRKVLPDACGRCGRVNYPRFWIMDRGSVKGVLLLPLRGGLALLVARKLLVRAEEGAFGVTKGERKKLKNLRKYKADLRGRRQKRGHSRGGKGSLPGR